MIVTIAVVIDIYRLSWILSYNTCKISLFITHSKFMIKKTFFRIPVQTCSLCGPASCCLKLLTDLEDIKLYVRYSEENVPSSDGDLRRML